MEAARQGAVAPPVDLRYLRRGVPTKGDSGGDSSRGRVVTFLRTIYESVAETLPDVRDSPQDEVDPHTSYMTVSLPLADPDPYTDAIHDPTMRLKLKPQAKGVRAKKLGIVMNTSRRPDTGLEKRWLPPGHIREYYEQFLIADGHSSTSQQKPVSFSTFWRTWYQDFGTILQFRATSSHTMCGTCVRHKCLIKSMSGHLKARQKQVELYGDHLRSQYNDRLVYWDLRAQSRLKSGLDLLIIIDGMDQAKFQYPRSDLFRSKDLQGLARPKAHIAAAIIHSRAVVFCVSPADVRKDANSSIDLVAFCLQTVAL